MVGLLTQPWRARGENAAQIVPHRRGYGSTRRQRVTKEIRQEGGAVFPRHFCDTSLPHQRGQIRPPLAAEARRRDFLGEDEGSGNYRPSDGKFCGLHFLADQGSHVREGNHAMRNHGGHHHKWSLIRRSVFAKLIAPARPAWSPLSREELHAVDVAIQIFECLPHFVRLLGMSAPPGRLKFRNVSSLPAKTTAASEQIQRFRVFPGGLAQAEDRTTVDRSFRPGHQFSGVSETPDFRDDDAPRQDRVVDPQGHDRVVRSDAIDGQCSDRRRRHDAVVRLGTSGLAQRRPGYPRPGRIEIEQPRLRA